MEPTTVQVGHVLLLWPSCLQRLLGMTIFARPADTRPGPTLMGRVLPGPIKNRVGYGFKKKKPETGPDFIKKTQTRPV